MKTIFTIQEGLNIQAQQLQGWENILKPEVYNHLFEYCGFHNNKINWDKDGYQVKRGSDLDNVIGNYMLGWRYVDGSIDYDNNVNKQIVATN